MRRLVDTHSEIACPAETDFALLVEAYVETANVLAGADQPGGGDDPRRLLGEAREVVDRLVRRYLDRVGKTLWCDKSLSNVLHLDLLAAAWPGARFILLHRNAMDFVASALVMQPWGLTNYGFTEFATRARGDAVGALVAYWLDRTSRLLAFEQHHPDRCLRMRYEDLVGGTDAEMARTWAFLDVTPEPDVSSRAFADSHRATVPTGSRGDNKTWYTSGVHTESVGRGARIPVQRIQPPALAAINDMGRRLGYPAVGSDWGAGGPLPGAAVPSDMLEVRIVQGGDTVWVGTTPLAPGATGPAVAAVDHDVVGDLREGRQNPAELTRTRRLRYYGPPIPDAHSERALVERIVACLSAAPW